MGLRQKDPNPLINKIKKNLFLKILIYFFQQIQSIYISHVEIINPLRTFYYLLYFNIKLFASEKNYIKKTICIL